MIHIVVAAEAGEHARKSANLEDMALTLDDLPDDAASLKALLLAERAQHAGEAARIQAERDVAIAERDRWVGQVERLRHIVRQLQRAQFGRRSERIDDEQLETSVIKL